MRVAITGATGQLGRALRATAPEGIEVCVLDRARLDLRDRDGIGRVIGGLRPQVVLNAAAYNAVDAAEDHREAAFAVNAVGVGWLAEATTAAGVRLIHLSTDYVFDGNRSRPYTPDDAPSPLSVYGASKREGEVRALETSGGRALVVRTAWVHSRFGSNFATRLLSRLALGEEIAMVDDQVGSPTWANGLARVLWQLCDRPEIAGILHWADAGTASRYGVAVAIREEAVGRGLLERPPPIRPARTGEYPARAERPAYSALDCRATEEALAIDRIPWRAAIGSMLAELESLPDG